MSSSYSPTFPNGVDPAIVLDNSYEQDGGFDPNDRMRIDTQIRNIQQQLTAGQLFYASQVVGAGTFPVVYTIPWTLINNTSGGYTTPTTILNLPTSNLVDGVPLRFTIIGAGGSFQLNGGSVNILDPLRNNTSATTFIPVAPSGSNTLVPFTLVIAWSKPANIWAPWS